MTVEIKRLNSQAPDFRQQLRDLQNRDTESDGAVMTRVNNIINAVRTRGDAALLEFTAEFDSLPADSVSQLELPLSRLQQMTVCLSASAMRSNRRRPGSDPMLTTKSWNPGNIPNPMAPCWVNK